jgi:tetratricopeptide (TPR) repeat protein
LAPRHSAVPGREQFHAGETIALRLEEPAKWLPGDARARPQQCFRGTREVCDALPPTEALTMRPPNHAPAGRDAEAARLQARAGDALAARGQLPAACARYEQATEFEPNNARFFYQLAVCEWQLGLDRAGEHFRKAAGLSPRFAAAHAALAAWSLQHGQVEEADRSSRTAAALAPEDHAALQTRAAVLEVTGELDAAWQLAEGLVGRGFVSLPLLRLYGRMACHRGRQARALELVQGHVGRPDLSAQDRARLHFTAAELLDSLARYDEAFDHARRANRLARPAYDPAAHERTFDLLIDYFTRDRLARLPRGSDRSEKPVFIVGMPRSGTSLVEQILASHPGVHGGGELDLMPRTWSGAVHALSARPEQYPSCLDRLTAAQADEIARLYLRPLAALNPAAPRITDKLPLNFLHLGLVWLLMPGARVVDCRRDPRDTCLSCYLAMFESGNDFKYDLGHTARFYVQYRRLMGHWKEALDLRVLEVSYEALVADAENQTYRMLDFLGLARDERCLRFYERKRPVTTSSVQQVRKPLYRSSVGRWRHYERHLTELNRWL